MYRNLWFNKNNYTKDIIVSKELPHDWIKRTEISKIFLSAWEEHCLECAVPQCYRNCAKWVERYDKKCQKTVYGIKLRKKILPEVSNGVQLKFREWGKIETIFSTRCVTIKKERFIHNVFCFLEKITLFTSIMLKWLSPTCKLCGALEVFKNIVIQHFGKAEEPDVFLFQCYSQEEPYKLFFEMGDKYRSSFLIKKGFNQFFINNSEVLLDKNTSSLLKFYPENNMETELVVLFSDFIKLKKTKKLFADKIKCVIWDLDNTIWDGILIETNPDLLLLRPSVLDTLKSLDERGIINVVVSKNDESHVLPVLERLGIIDYFVYIVANWNPKSENIKSIAKALNINCNTFAFIDDSTFERAEVTQSLPMVRAYDENSFPELLKRPEFDVIVTEDSKNRRVMYQTEVKRQKLKSDFKGNEVDFLKNCGIIITIENVNSETRERCYELIQRTNQLNLSGIKYQKEDFYALIEKNTKQTFAVHCEDKYGSYGLVGFFMINNQNNNIYIIEYAMSCRVAKKWIEPAILDFFKQLYSPDKIVFDGVYNKKNDLLINTLESFGLKNEAQEDGKLLLTIASKDINFPNVVKVVSKVK